MRCAGAATGAAEDADEVSTIDELFPVPGPPLAGRLGAEACRNAFCREVARDAAAKGNRPNMPVAVSVVTSVQVEIREENIRRRSRRLGKDEECLILRLYVGEIPRSGYAAAPNEPSASLRTLLVALAFSPLGEVMAGSVGVQSRFADRRSTASIDSSESHMLEVLPSLVKSANPVYNSNPRQDEAK